MEDLGADGVGRGGEGIGWVGLGWVAVDVHRGRRRTFEVYQGQYCGNRKLNLNKQGLVNTKQKSL